MYCAFTRRLYSLMSKPHLKPHHHVKLTRETRLDLSMWDDFLSHPMVYCRPFLDFSADTNAETLDFYTDSSGVMVWMVSVQAMDGRGVVQCFPE